MPNDPAPLPPVVRYRALCSDCVDAVRAIEVHLIPDGAVAYCARCAPTYRPYASRILSIPEAWRERVRITL